MILGERIRLRRLERDDLPRCAAWLNDPDVRRHLALLYPMSLVLEDEKCGFRPEGRQRQSRFQDGRYLDTLMMAVLRDEWNG